MKSMRFLKKIVVASWVIGNIALCFGLIGNFINNLDLTGIAATIGGFNSVELGLSAIVKKAEQKTS